MRKITIILISFFSITYIQSFHSQNNKPNILLIIADDMGIDVTNGYQQNAVMPTTPTLDSLRVNGITYKNTWSAPTCTPTRASILSGKYGVKTGVMRAPGNLELSHTSVFNMLTTVSGDAYAKALIGKWHVSNPVDYNHPEDHGIDYYQGAFTAFVDDYYDWEKVTNGNVSRESEYVTTHITNSAIDWVNDQNQPWLLCLSHIAPHSPFHIPPSDLYSISNTTGDQNKYIAAIEAMDHEIGRLIYNMDEDTRKNTIILFVGDNGTPGPVIQNFTNGHAKASLYEGGIRVPLIVSGKGVSRINEEEDGLVHVADIYATILELAGHQLDGGIYNSSSFKPSFSCANEIQRNYVYTDYLESNVLSWAIRNNQYKLIEDENGNQEFYDIVSDILEGNNLIGNLSTEQQTILSELSDEANTIRTAWSCNDGIKNGDEMGIDACDSVCSNDNSLSTGNIGCCASPQEPSVFYEYIEGGQRKIYTNDFPSHDYCFNPNLVPEQKHYNFGIDLNPVVSNDISLLIRDNGRPSTYFGVAKNGVLIAPAPAEPFIFENSNTGEFNWDWVFEPLNNQGDGAGLVALDCSSAHTGPQGYHYHGNMYEYMETIIPGVTVTQQAPSKPIHIGWAADGFPIVYRFGPDTDGNIKELLPSFQLKRGERPGNGIEAPCGPYNGKYTNDYEYICGTGDLDACNGIDADIDILTTNGIQTFSYYYVITSQFPQISRCLVGNVSSDFSNRATELVGIDNDNDGFLSQFDCNDNNPELNPLTTDESCNLLSITDLDLKNLYIGPNPSNGNLLINYGGNTDITITIYDITGKLVYYKKGRTMSVSTGLEHGMYILQAALPNQTKISKKIIIK